MHLKNGSQALYSLRSKNNKTVRGGNIIHKDIAAPSENRRMNKRTNRKSLGKAAEMLAALFIKNKGFIVIEKNFRCRMGEIDIIAKHRGFIVIIEVRSAAGNSFHDPLDSITQPKMERLRRLALMWLKLHKCDEPLIRFDVITVIFTARAKARIRHIENAF